MSPPDFPHDHPANMRQDVPLVELPFYQWMNQQKDLPDSLAETMERYYGRCNIKECISSEEINHYWKIYIEAWRRRGRGPQPARHRNSNRKAACRERI